MADRHRLVWSRTALDDLAGIVAYVADSDGVDRARALYGKVRARVDALATFPRRGRLVPELRRLGLIAFRELVVPPYRVFYRVDRNTVVLLGVVDGRRDLEEFLLERALRSLERGND